MTCGSHAFEGFVPGDHTAIVQRLLNAAGHIVGKPMYGLVPLHGVVELAHSMDHVGLFARDVETTARGLDVIAALSTPTALEIGGFERG